MTIVYREATNEDYEELIQLRIRNMRENYKEVSGYAEDCMRKQLADYFDRKLGKDGYSIYKKIRFEDAELEFATMEIML